MSSARGDAFRISITPKGYALLQKWRDEAAARVAREQRAIEASLRGQR